jgi:FkbM family methyltransferase
MSSSLERGFQKAWPALFRGIAGLNRVLPAAGPVRRWFEDVVFTRHWNRWYRIAYVPENRDRFFEHILTFFYRYPVKAGDVVVQVGASFGEETRRFARAVGRQGRVIAVEPEAGNLERIRQTVPAAEFPQVTIVPKGAWKECGQLRFLVGGEREHRLADLGAADLTYQWWGVSDHLNDARYRGATTIEVETLDNIIAAAGVDHVDFILVETNGAELEVIQGLDAALPRVRRIGARGHVRRDGVPIFVAIQEHLARKGLATAVTSEEMVLARQPGLRP